MKVFFQILIIVFTFCDYSHAQNRPLRGSGKIIQREFSFRDFDKIQFKDLNGDIEVESGKNYGVKISIDDNLEYLLECIVADGKLMIGFRGNKSNRLYIENTNIKIKVSLPEISVLQHTGNSRLKVRGIAGRYFRLENHGNGDAYLMGTIDSLDIDKVGNGDVNAEDLTAKIAKVISHGNGDVKVNVSVSLSANGTGNGDIIKTGSGKIEGASGIIGNGEVRSAQ